MVLFVPLFCMAFIFFYHPEDFGAIDRRFYFGIKCTDDTAWHILISIMVLIGMAVAALNRLIMQFYTRNHSLTYIGYIFWVAMEIIAMTLIYSTVACLNSEHPFFEIYETTFVKTIRTLLIPYVICYLYFIWTERSHQFKQMKELLEEDDMALRKAYVQIFDERGKMQFSIRPENLLMIESADNYVCIWYDKNNTPSRTMVRTTIKKLAPSLEGTSIRRCHRSYMVNLDHVKVLAKEPEGLFIDLFLPGVPKIPLSKTYAADITNRLAGNSTEKSH